VPTFGIRAHQVNEAGVNSVAAPGENTACEISPPEQSISIDPSNLRISIKDPAVSTRFLQKRRNIIINFCTNPPVSGAQVRVYIQHSPNSAGHTVDHPGLPPHGWLTSGATDPKKFPVFYDEGNLHDLIGTEDHSTLEKAFVVTLDSNGTGSVLYGVPEVSGDDTITASFLYRGQRQDRRFVIHVMEPELEDLAPQAGNLIELTGTTSKQGKRHPSNHWGTKEMNEALLDLARNYVAEYQRTVLSPKPKLPIDASRLPLNDMSIIYGGVFDLEGNWNRPNGSHVGHRAGVEADLGGNNTGHGLVPGRYTHFAKIVRDQGSFGLLPEGDPPHWHVVLRNRGNVTIRALPTQPTRIDAATIQVAVPLENQGGLRADHMKITALSATNGVTVVSPRVSESSVLDLGAGEIRGAKTLTVTVLSPPEVKTFRLRIAGYATNDQIQISFPIPPLEFEKDRQRKEFLDVGVKVPPLNGGAVEGALAPQATPATPGWSLTLTDADQPITIGSDMVYHGAVTNDTGAPIYVSTADIYYAMTAARGAFTYDLADEFLNAQGIPVNGYSGPLFKVHWTEAPAVSAGGDLWFTLDPDADSGLPFLEASAHLAYKPQAIMGSVKNGILTLSWSLEATGMQLQSSSTLDEPQWVDVPGNVTQVDGMNTLALPAPTKRTYFRLVSLDGEDVVGESSVFTAGPSALLNISTRMQVLTGDNVLIAGFIITGNASKEVIVRAIGPSLSNAGVPNALANPVLELHDASGTLIAQNDDWQTTQMSGVITADQGADIQASKVAPAHPNESAIIATLAPGAYTAIVHGAGGTTGVGLAEVFDLSPTADSTLANISSRGLVQTGDNVMIGGFIAGGAGPTKVIVRAIGPSLPLPSALENPTLELYDGNGSAIAANDDWRSHQESDIIATLVAPTNDAESAIVQTLNPGNYTAIVRGSNETTGVAVVEVYNLQ
jgi:hypothetical protein